MIPIEVIPLSAAIGAEISGLDLRQPLDAATREAVERAWYDHLVLAFRDQDLSFAEQKAFALQFGDISVRGGDSATVQETSLSENVMLVSNIRENGKPIGIRTPNQTERTAPKPSE